MMPDPVSRSAVQLGAALVVATLIGGGVAYLTLKPTGEIDPFNCPADRLAPAHTVLIIDATDRLEPNQAARLVDTAEAAARALPRHGRFTILLVQPDSPWEPEQVISLCSPGRGSEADPLTETGALYERAWREQFLAPLQTAAGRLTSIPASEESPILQSLASVASRRDFAAEATGRRLIYVGDGLQHTAGGYSHYRSGDPTQAYRASQLASELDPEFSGAVIEVEYLRRPVAAGVQGANHKAFWRWWFAEHGASDVIIRGG